MSGRTSSRRISVMSHFESTTIVAHCALRATSATATILLDDALARVDQDERDVCALRGLERAELRVVLDPLTLLSLPPETGRVDEHERRVVAPQDGVDRVSCRSRDVGDDDALTARRAR